LRLRKSRFFAASPIYI